MGQNRVSTGVRAALALTLLAGAALLSACNTVSGAGQDLKDASDATKKAITGDDTKSSDKK
ncbi:MAG: hypothetical protein U0638_11085 [Phycisphaerales bacterium]